MFQEYLQNEMDGETTVLAIRKAWRTYRTPVGVDQNRRTTMIRDQDDHRGIPDDFLLRRTSKSVTLGCLGKRKEHEEKKRMKERSFRLKQKGQNRWNAARGRREEDCRIVKEEGRIRGGAKWLRKRGTMDTTGMKPRLGLESDAAAKKFMWLFFVQILRCNIVVIEEFKC